TEVVAKARSIAREVASRHAGDVDDKARFPHETFGALREAKLLSAVVPKELGGTGSDMQELSECCMELAQGCASSGMVLTIHQIHGACIAPHGLAAPFFRTSLQELVETQHVIASVTSEVGVGGNTRSSICAIQPDGTLDKDATTVSYGAQADDLLVTC